MTSAGERTTTSSIPRSPSPSSRTPGGRSSSVVVMVWCRPLLPEDSPTELGPPVEARGSREQSAAPVEELMLHLYATPQLGGWVGGAQLAQAH